MAHFQFLVFSNPVEGREAEYHDWYENVHLSDVLKVPGFTGVTRMEIVEDPEAPQALKFLVVYEMEADDPSVVLDELIARVEGGKIEMSDALGDVETRLYKAISPRRTS